MISLLKEQINKQTVYTENGALGYRTSGHKLLDLNFKASSLRNMQEKEIVGLFEKAFFENPELTVRWLFYLRDIRGGMGERRSFRIMFNALADLRPEETARLLPLISEYGRWDDVVFASLHRNLKNPAYELIAKQFTEDLQNCLQDKPISLLAKWLPSYKTKKEMWKPFVHGFIEGSGLTPKEYSRGLKVLREKLKIVESQMSERRWNEIDYNTVPSRANLLYTNAFFRHDGARRLAYLDSLKKGDGTAKIHAGTLFPSDIVASYVKGSKFFETHIKEYDETLEQLWKNLSDTSTDGDTLVVADGSGSMCNFIKKSQIRALDVSNALAVYFAERLKGPYYNQFITFSSHPKYVNLNNAQSLRDKLKITYSHDDCSNTNIAATFNLILETALENHLSQSEIPSTVLIISDMEFDPYMCKIPFKAIAASWEAHGYSLPKLVFWNVASRSGAIPCRQNENGVILLSGFSPAIYKMAMNNEVDPYKALVRVVMDSRYDAVESAWKDV